MTILLSILLLLSSVLGFGMGDCDLTPNCFTKQGYSNIMADTIARSDKNPRVVEIAMLGAHDAFTAGIRASSPQDPNWDALWTIWHDANAPDTLLQKIGALNEDLASDPTWGQGRFRWNQAQLTAQTDFPAVLRVIPDYSLLLMAHRLNYKLLPDLAAWLPQMPILGVDYADDMCGGFNDKAMEIINGYNAGL